MQKKDFLILVINPGSTSTKVALYEGERLRAEAVLRHSDEELRRFPDILDQLPLRLRAVEEFLQQQGVTEEDLDAVVGRGGLLRPVEGGTYRVNQAMLKDAREGRQGKHPSNLGCILAHEIARRRNIPAFVVDPVSVDEFEPLARYSGHPLLERKCLSHALNLHAVARKVAAELGVPYGESRFVVAHLGGGISVAAMKGGRIIDVNDASSAGPFSPDRTGTLPLQGFIDLCFSGRYTKDQIKRMVMGEGGLKAYLGTADAQEVERRIQAGDQKAREVMEAMAYQIAKEIGAMATVLYGKLHAVVLTGGLARYGRLVSWIRQRVEFIGPVKLVPGEFEMEALALGALRVLRGEEKAREY